MHLPTYSREGLNCVSVPVCDPQKVPILHQTVCVCVCVCECVCV